MKKIIISFIFLTLIFIVGCKASTTYNIEYICEEGAHIEGDAHQKVKNGENGKEIELVIEEGYYFDSWSDGLETLTRSETNVTKNLTLTAKIKKVCKVTYQVSMKEAGSIAGELNQVIKDKNGTTQVYARANRGFKFVKWSDGVTSPFRRGDIYNEDVIIKAIFKYEKYDIPVITIDTNNVPVVSKEDYIPMNLSISNTEDEYILSNVKGKIRGRGNSTWGMPKTPYKIKFEKKQNLFGGGSSKTWTLIANYCDKSLIRNYLAYELSSMCSGIDYTTNHIIVEVVFNQEYQGVYLLCDQMEVGKTRVNIEEDSKDVNTGYLLELDNRAPEEGVANVDYFYSNGIPYAIKSPKTDSEYYSTAQLEYIKEYLNASIDAINIKKMEVIKKYIDVDSFVDTYIIQELFKNCDVGYSSFYLYKDKGGVLKAGPIWDFDISSGNCDYSDSDTPYYYRTRNVNIWYQKLMNVNDFYELVKKRYKELQPAIESIILKCNDILVNYKNAFERNFEKWPILGIYVWPNTEEIVNCKTVESQIYYLSNWLSTRNQWLLGVLE